MKPTDDLKEEHRAIRIMLKILNGICVDLESGKDVDRKHLEQIVEFMKVFVDDCHHTKEEAYLFPGMKREKVPGVEELIASFLEEHEKGRQYVREIDMAISGKIDPEAISTIVTNARDYTQLLMRHIDKEDKYLFPVADSRLKPDTQENLLESFERVETEKIGPGKHKGFHSMLHELKEIYIQP